jgi:hypothetical protein
VEGGSLPGLTLITGSPICSYQEPTYDGDMQMVTPSIRPQDVLVACKLHLAGRAEPTLAVLAAELGMSTSDVSRALARCRACGLVREDERPRVDREALVELLSIALPRLYCARRGPVTVGIPTGTSASVLSDHFRRDPKELPLVWPSPRGLVRGESLAPVVRSAPGLFEDDGIYELLALVDVVRTGTQEEVAKARRLVRDKIFRRDP